MTDESASLGGPAAGATSAPGLPAAVVGGHLIAGQLARLLGAPGR